MLHFEELSIGVKNIFRDEYLVTEEEIIEVGQRWDPQPFHTDPVAAKESIFGGLVASSAHIFSIYVRIGNVEIDQDVHVEAVSALGFDKLQWQAPVRPNDVLRSGYEVIARRESKSKPDLGIVTMSSRVFNQKDETVFTLECTFLVKKRE
jgi:acyl dehydratase